jgi:SAM-dependent methyltransferase
MTKIYTISKDPTEAPLFAHELEALDNPQGCVLDLGAGEGTFNYGKFRCRVVAADRDFPSHPPRGSLVVCDAEALPFASGIFDVVIANFSFEHFTHPDRVLPETDRVLGENGLLYVSIPNGAALEDRLFRLLSGGRYHFQKYSFHSLLRLVYQRTTLKLVSFADWPAGYTWLRKPSDGSLLRRIVFRCLLPAKGLLRRHGRGDSGWVMLFAKAQKSGFRSIIYVCEHCGAGASPGSEASSTWQCSQCNGINRIS